MSCGTNETVEALKGKSKALAESVKNSSAFEELEAIEAEINTAKAEVDELSAQVNSQIQTFDKAVEDAIGGITAQINAVGAEISSALQEGIGIVGNQLESLANTAKAELAAAFGLSDSEAADLDMNALLNASPEDLCKLVPKKEIKPDGTVAETPEKPLVPAEPPASETKKDPEKIATKAPNTAAVKQLEKCLLVAEEWSKKRRSEYFYDASPMLDAGQIRASKVSALYTTEVSFQYDELYARLAETAEEERWPGAAGGRTVSKRQRKKFNDHPFIKSIGYTALYPNPGSKLLFVLFQKKYEEWEGAAEVDFTTAVKDWYKLLENT